MSNHARQPEKATEYQAYLLRLWREKGADWRVSLQSTTGQRYGFADLQAALHFVEDNLKHGDSNKNDADENVV